MTKEHVWPDWLRKVILDSRASGGQNHFHAEIESGGKTRTFKSTNLEITVRMPCGNCNHGWMSALEHEVRDLMTAMVFRGEAVSLSPERRVALMRWAVKTAMVYEFTGMGAGSEQKYFSAAERLSFKELFELPENLWIWTSRYEGPRPMHALQRRATAEGRIGPPTIYSLTLTANFVVLQLFAYRNAAGDLARVADATTPQRLLRLSATPSEWQPWPPLTTIDDYALAVLDDRFMNVLSQKN